MFLSKISTKGPEEWVKEEEVKETEKFLIQIGELTNTLFAEEKQSLLIVVQGMDASGKDGLIKGLFRECSPQWVQVRGYGKPSPEELSHDYLWRINQEIPAKGTIKVFNRSHYEDILVPSIYGYLPKKEIDKRYEQINAFENHLEANGVKVLKLYLHLSLEKQEEKLLERINDKTKHWKHNDADWETRDKWNDFMKVYEKIFTKCSDIPWHIVPTDKNWVKLRIVSELVARTLKAMKPKFPVLVSEKFTPDYLKVEK